MSAGPVKSAEVVVAMSGGVDSSVAALLLKQQGYDAIGVSMQVWDYRKNGGCDSKATCCSPDDFTDARKVAAKIGIPYYVFDFEKTFRKEVIDKFISSYAQGITPNPCVECNNKVKFRELRDRAAAFARKFVATGHYARIEERGGKPCLLRGRDLAKDQSYFLYGLSRDELEQTIFPVGNMLKSEVRELAREAGLNTAEKAESQDICFVSGSVREFLHTIGGLKKRGDIVTAQGIKIGEHDGIHNFTVGQRRGIAVGGQEDALYVTELDKANNRVVVGSRKELERESFTVSECNWLVDLPQTFKALAQVRHRHKGVPVEVSIAAESGSCIVKFCDQTAVVSPGQAAVFYDSENEQVLGGGKITLAANSYYAMPRPAFDSALRNDERAI